MSSIPLPALSVKPPEQGASPLSVLANVQQLKNAQQEQQMHQIQIQNAQIQQQDQLKLRSLFIKHQGDMDKVVAEAPAAGVSPQTIQGLQLHAIDVKTKTADLVAKQGANAALQADLMQGAHEKVDSAKAEDRPQEYQKQLAGLQQRGVDVSQMPPQYPGDDQFKLIGAMVQGHKQQVEDAVKASEKAKYDAQAASDQAAVPGKVAEGKIKEAEANMLSQGGMNKEMADAKYLGLQTRAKQGVPIAPPDKAFMAAYEKQKTLNATTTFNLNNAVPKGEAGQPSAIAQAIAANQMKWNDAVSPRTPMNVKEALLKEIKGINPNFNSGDFHVEQKVKEAFTSGKPAEELTAFNTAIAHADLLKTASEALKNGDVRALNSLGNKLGVEFGSDKQTNFRIIADAYTREVNKALTSGHVTDSEIKEIGGTIPANASPAQLTGAVNTYRALMQSKVEQRKNQYEAGKKAQPNFGGSQGGGKIVVTAPDGSKHPFDTQAQADAFKKLANIQ